MKPLTRTSKLTPKLRDLYRELLANRVSKYAIAQVHDAKKKFEGWAFSDFAVGITTTAIVADRELLKKCSHAAFDDLREIVAAVQSAKDCPANIKYSHEEAAGAIMEELIKAGHVKRSAPNTTS